MAEPAVAIIGGGIQGVCAALALARIGVRVVIIDAADSLLDRASFRSEGKVHLGFVYAQDPTGKTAELMLDSALSFGPLVEGWIGPVDWAALRSRPFAYATLPDSQLSASELLEHYNSINEAYCDTYRRSGLHYLGLTPESLLAQAGSCCSPRSEGWPVAGTVVADTAEVALDLVAFRTRMRAAVAHMPQITVRTGHRVEDVVRTAAGFQVSAVDSSGRVWRRDFAVVVNCSWTDRLRLDKQVGLEPDRGWVYRLKYRVIGRLPDARQRSSLTFALGPYGDVVTYDDDRVYISWYPACLRGWSRELMPPAEWGRACSGLTGPAESADVTRAVMDEFGEIIPALRDTIVETVDAGVIFSWGSRDIDQRESELHRRSEIGVEGGDGYYTINTGKFTCAPLFASHLVNRLRADGGLD